MPSQDTLTLSKEPGQPIAGILDSVLDAVITVDAGMDIRIFNRAAGQMFGYEPASMLGQPLSRLIPPAGRALHAASVAGFAEFGTSARPMGSMRMLTGLHADGSEIPIEASISRVGEGEDAWMTAVIRDTQKQRALEGAREAYISAEAAHRAKTEFLSRMSHELRTPLNAVLGLTSLLQSSTCERITPAEHDQIGLVLAAGQRLRALVDDMLAMGVASVETPALPEPPLLPAIRPDICSTSKTNR